MCIFWSFLSDDPIPHQQDFLHSVVRLSPTLSESNEISGGNYADTPSDGLITEKLRLNTGKNPSSPITSPIHIHLLISCVIFQKKNKSCLSPGLWSIQKRMNSVSVWKASEKCTRLKTTSLLCGETCGLVSLVCLGLFRIAKCRFLFHINFLFVFYPKMTSFLM